MKVEIDGRRAYVLGDTYAIKDRLKQAGCKWDPDRRAWWIGAAKAASVEALISSPQEPVKEDLSKLQVYGKVTYKGRNYYVIAQSRDGKKLRLTVLDGSIDFWAGSDACDWVKHYEEKGRFGGYGRGTVYSRPTLGSIQRFVADQKNEATRRGECTECGHWGPSGEACTECGGEGSYS